MSIDNTEDMIDSREVIERIEELKAEFTENTGDDGDDFAMSEDDWAFGLGEAGAHELVTLLELAKDGEDYYPDWTYGETLIRDSFFEQYAQDLADDIGAVPRDYTWPTSCIDWKQAARELQMDYTSVEFDGITYWAR